MAPTGKVVPGPGGYEAGAGFEGSAIPDSVENGGQGNDDAGPAVPGGAGVGGKRPEGGGGPRLRAGGIGRDDHHALDSRACAELPAYPIPLVRN